MHRDSLHDNQERIGVKSLSPCPRAAVQDPLTLGWVGNRRRQCLIHPVGLEHSDSQRHQRLDEIALSVIVTPVPVRVCGKAGTNSLDVGRRRSDRGKRGNDALHEVREGGSPLQRLQTAKRRSDRRHQVLDPKPLEQGVLAPDDIAHRPCVILSTERMRSIEPVDTASATLVVQAGVALQAVQGAADSHGLLFPLDIGSRGSCTIGGNISTNAGGNRVLRYGMMRDLVLGLEAVLADGTILTSLNRMQKNNAGYDLEQLFIGTEGTLGVVTRAVLRLFPKPSTTQTALCAVEDYGRVLQLLSAAKSQLNADLAAFEVMWPDFYRLGTDGLGLRAPLPHGFGAYVLIESQGSDPRRDQPHFEEFVESVLTAGTIADAVIGQSIQESQDIWRIRDSSGEFHRTFWPYVGFDVSIPVGDIGRFIEGCKARLAARWPRVQTVWFGHAADSNIHICVRLPGVEPQPQQDIDTIVYDCVGEYAGSISAEHGIGLVKRAFLSKSRTTAEIATMRLLNGRWIPTPFSTPGRSFLETAQGSHFRGSHTMSVDPDLTRAFPHPR
jgi:FAD/FMN-containing dehydrogenase